MKPINYESGKDKMRAYLRHPVSFIIFLLVALSLITFFCLNFLVQHILIKGFEYYTKNCLP